MGQHRPRMEYLFANTVVRTTSATSKRFGSSIQARLETNRRLNSRWTTCLLECQRRHSNKRPRWPSGHFWWSTHWRQAHRCQRSRNQELLDSHLQRRWNVCSCLGSQQIHLPLRSPIGHVAQEVHRKRESQSRRHPRISQQPQPHRSRAARSH